MPKKWTTYDYAQWLTKNVEGIYIEDEYLGNNTAILHKCTLGHTFMAYPANIKSGHLCSVCSKYTTSTYNKWLTKYRKNIVALEDFVTNKTKILHRCLTCNIEWRATPNSIKGSVSCPNCAKCCFNPSQPAILYYLEVNGGIAYKIGVTNTSVKDRCSRLGNKLIELQSWYFNNGQEAYELEQLILKSYKHLKYTGEPLLNVGNTELFKEDILKLDKHLKRCYNIFTKQKGE